MSSCCVCCHLVDVYDTYYVSCHEHPGGVCYFGVIWGCPGRKVKKDDVMQF